MNGRGKSATVIDAQSGKVVATMPLEGKPESAQADSKAGKVYVNIGGSERHQGDRHRHAQGHRDLADCAGRGGDRHGVRRGERTGCSSAATTS